MCIWVVQMYNKVYYDVRYTFWYCGNNMAMRRTTLGTAMALVALAAVLTVSGALVAT